MKILLFGAFGQLGTAIRELRKGHEIDVINKIVDISDEKDIKGILASKCSFDVAINVAAFTHVDKCEQEEFSAFLVNALGAKFLAQGISRYNISKNKVMEVSIPIPNLEEQTMVGRYFSTLDHLITLHQRQHKLHLNMLL